MSQPQRGGADGDVAQPAKRARSSTTSHLPQDLIDEIVDCVADDTDLAGLLRLRAVCSRWARAVRAASLNDRFCDSFSVNTATLDELDSMSYAGEPNFRIVVRQRFFVVRVQLVLWRTGERARVNLGHRNDAALFKRILAPVVVPSDEAVPDDRRQAPVTSLRPLAPAITLLDLAGSTKEAVNDDTMRRFAELLPVLRGLDVRNCSGVTNINAFEKHGLVSLDVSGDCGVNTAGMTQLTYIKKLVALRRQPVLLDRFAGRLAELNISDFCERYDAFASLFASSSMLLSSPTCVLQRLTKLDASKTRLQCRQLLTATPALTDLILDGVMRQPGGNFDHLNEEVEIPPGVPLRRLSLKWFDLELSGLRNCADTLTWLDLQFCRTIRNDDIADLRALRWLNITGSPITSLGPFVETLTALFACGDRCRITDASLAGARELRTLDVSYNPSVTSILPCAASLTDLRANGATGLAGVDLSKAPHLTKLSAQDDDCVITDTHVQHCTALKELTCFGNERITTILPFIETVEILRGAYNVPQEEFDAAPRLASWR